MSDLARSESGEADYCARIRAVGFKRNEWEWEIQSTCPICYADPHTMLSQHDRYGHEVWMVGCKRCGMVWLMRRLTPASYTRYYGEGWYRRFVSAAAGVQDNSETMQAEMAKVIAFQRSHARLIVAMIQKGGEPVTSRIMRNGAVLDIGGSTGTIGINVAKELCAPDAPVVIVDPATWESEGRQENAHVFPTLLEARRAYPDLRYSLILICQTLDHLSTPIETLRAAAELLTPDGFIWCDVLNTVVEHDRNGANWHATAKLDHPMYFDGRTASLTFALAGLGICGSTSIDKDRHIVFLLEAKR